MAVSFNYNSSPSIGGSNTGDNNNNTTTPAATTPAKPASAFPSGISLGNAATFDRERDVGNVVRGNAEEAVQNNKIRTSAGQAETDYGVFFESKTNELKQAHKEGGLDKDGDGAVDKNVTDSDKNNFHKSQEKKYTSEREQIIAKGGDTTEVDSKIERSQAMQDVYNGRPSEGISKLKQSNAKLSIQIEDLQSQAKNESNPERKSQLMSRADNLIWERTHNVGLMSGIDGRMQTKGDSLAVGKTATDDLQQNNTIRQDAGLKETDYTAAFKAKENEFKTDVKAAGLDTNNDGMVDKDVPDSKKNEFNQNQEKKYVAEREQIVAKGGDTTVIDSKINRTKAMQDVYNGKPEEGAAKIKASNEKLTSEIDSLQSQASKETDPAKKSQLLDKADALILERMDGDAFILGINSRPPTPKPE